MPRKHAAPVLEIFADEMLWGQVDNCEVFLLWLTGSVAPP